MKATYLGKRLNGDHLTHCFLSDEKHIFFRGSFRRYFIGQIYSLKKDGDKWTFKDTGHEVDSELAQKYRSESWAEELAHKRVSTRKKVDALKISANVKEELKRLTFGLRHDGLRLVIEKIVMDLYTLEAKK